MNINSTDSVQSVLFDTGSVISIISSNILHREKLPLTTEVEEQNISGISSTPVKTIGTTEFLRLRGTQFKVLATVIEYETPLFILGTRFMTTNYVKIDYSRFLLTIDSQTIEISEPSSKELSDPEKDLSDKTKIFNITQHDVNCLINKHFPNPNKLGRIKNVSHSIEVSSNIPVSSKLYKLTQELTQKLKKEIDKMESEDLISKSDSKYASPAFIILKRNGQIRLVVDYRKLNSITLAETYPFPAVEDQLKGLHGSLIFSQIDLNKGFYQIEMNPEDIKKTSFVLPFGQYQFHVMPFGLKNSPRTFQRAMEKILGDLEFVKIFLDDVLVFSKSPEDHMKHLDIIFTRIEENGATINQEKSSFLQSEVEYLGYVINKFGVNPSPRSVMKLQKMAIPKNAKQLRRLIGLINYLRPFIKNLSEKLSPLTDTLKGITENKKKFIWTLNMEQALANINNYLMDNPTLHHPDPCQPFVLQTDASDNGIGACLLQNNKIVGLYSSKFNNAQRNYPIMDKEAYAIVKGLLYFKTLIYHSPICIQTDHSNLKYLDTTTSQRAQRWKCVLSDFNLSIQYLPGKDNHIADALSRVHLVEIRTIGNNLENEVERLHHELLHPGENKLYKTLSEYVPTDTKGLSTIVKRITKRCQECALEKNETRNYGYLLGTVNSTTPFEQVHLDLYGPIETVNYNNPDYPENIYVLSMIDAYSRFLRF